MNDYNIKNNNNEYKNILNKDKISISKLFKQYISIILNEYQYSIPNEIKNKLENIDNFENLVKIYDTNTISLFATPSDFTIHLPLQAYSVIKLLSTYKEYGSNKNHKTHNKENMIINDNTFRDFVKHVIIK